MVPTDRFLTSQKYITNFFPLLMEDLNAWNLFSLYHLTIFFPPQLIQFISGWGPSLKLPFGDGLRKAFVPSKTDDILPPVSWRVDNLDVELLSWVVAEGFLFEGKPLELPLTCLLFLGSILFVATMVPWESSYISLSPWPCLSLPYYGLLGDRLKVQMLPWL